MSPVRFKSTGKSPVRSKAVLGLLKGLVGAFSVVERPRGPHGVECPMAILGTVHGLVRCGATDLVTYRRMVMWPGALSSDSAPRTAVET